MLAANVIKRLFRALYPSSQWHTGSIPGHGGRKLFRCIFSARANRRAIKYNNSIEVIHVDVFSRRKLNLPIKTIQIIPVLNYRGILPGNINNFSRLKIRKWALGIVCNRHCRARLHRTSDHIIENSSNITFIAHKSNQTYSQNYKKNQKKTKFCV